MAYLYQLIKEKSMRNKICEDLPLLGVNKDKEFMPSVANTIGTDLSSYKIIRKGQFAVNLMHVDRDEIVPVSLLTDYEKAIVSPAYNVFKIIDESILNNEYLMLCFKRNLFDKNAWFLSGSSVRGNLEWRKFLEIDIPLPNIEEQLRIVSEYKCIEERISIKEAINNNLLQQITEILKSNKIESVISLREFPSLVEISSGIKKFVYNKKYFATGDINNGRFLSSYELISYKNRPSRANMQPVNNSIWFAKMQFTKKTVYFDNNIDNKTQDRILSTGFMGVQCDQKYLYYLLAFILSDDFEAQKDKFATGTTQIAINSSAIDKIMIPFEEIVAVELNYKFEKIFNQIQVNNNELEKLEILKNILITKLATQQ